MNLHKLLRYKKGEMKGKERNSFERELQKDPFAEEAEEGFELMSPGQASQDIDHLQKRLNRRTHGKRTGTGYRIAAAVAVLMIISSVFIVIVKQNKPAANVALMEKPEMLEIDRSAPLQAPAGSKPERTLKEPDRRQRSAESSKAEEQNTKPRENEAAAGNQVKLYNNNIAARSVNASKSGNDEKLEAPAEAVSPAPEAGNEKKEDITAKKARGISTAVVSYQQGYQPPRPAAGEEAFQKYISENIRRPDSTDQRVVVVVEFIVRTDGTRDSLKVIRSPGQQFSDEAMRLIKSGPLWEPAQQDGKPVEGKAQVKVVFP